MREVTKRTIGFPKILDVGCGTADLSLAISTLGPVIGCDFCQPMLRIGKEKIAQTVSRKPISLLSADALLLPFKDASFDVVVSAFVLRNLADIDAGLREMKRVLRPGGALGVLDFGLPETPVLGKLYEFYFFRILPRIGKLISGVDGPYGYLPASVQSFPPAVELKRRAESAGFGRVDCRLLMGGIAILLLGNSGKPIPSSAASP